jgi:hypothetical protein
MGRREDGAAAGTRPEIRLDPAGSMTGEIPPSIDAAPRAGGKRSLWRSGDGGAPLAGITTCRQELADRRGWSTFSKARPAGRKTPQWSAGRRLVPSRSEETPRKRLIGRSRRPLTGGLANPRVCRRSAPLVGSRDLEFGLRRTRRRSNNTGGGALAVCKLNQWWSSDGAAISRHPPLEGRVASECSPNARRVRGTLLTPPPSTTAPSTQCAHLRPAPRASPT